MDDTQPWFVRNRERHNENGRKWRSEHREQMREIYKKQNAARKERRAELHQEMLKDNPLKLMLQRTKARAKSMGIPFALSEKDFPDGIPEMCPVLGIPIVIGGGKMSDNSPSFDRVDNTLGYVPYNVIIVSLKANAIKRNASVDELKAVANFYEKLSAKNDNS